MWKAQRNGSVYLEERVKDKKGKYHTVSVKVRTTQKEAKKELDEKVEQFNDKKVKFSKLCKMYFNEAEKTLKKSTLDGRKNVLNNIIKVCGDFDVNNITAGCIRECLIDSGKNMQTLNSYIQVLKIILHWGYQNDYVTDYDVIGKLKGFKVTPERIRVADKYLEPYELKMLIDGMTIGRYKLLTEFLALSGCRIGEAIALDRDDVQDTYIKIYKTVYAKDGSIGTAKTTDSNREVFIQPELRNCLKRIDKCMQSQAECFGYEPTEYLFTDKNGKRISYFAYNEYLKIYSEKILGRKITPHTLRHTMTSIFASQGVSLENISRRLGHADDGVTKEIYLHVTEEMRKNDNLEIANTKVIDITQATTQAITQAKFY